MISPHRVRVPSQHAEAGLLARRDGEGGGIVTLPRNIHSMAFAAGIKGQANKGGLNWRFTVSQPLQPVDGTLSVSYDNYYGRLVTRKVALADNRDLRTTLQVSLTW